MNLAAAVRIVGATARITRLITEDDVPGEWWIKEPIDAAMERYESDNTRTLPVEHGGHLHFEANTRADYFDRPWWWRYREGLDCPWCVSAHVAFWLVLVEHTLPDRGVARKLWNIGTGALASSYVAARAETLLDGIDA